MSGSIQCVNDLQAKISGYNGGPNTFSALMLKFESCDQRSTDCYSYEEKDAYW